MQVPYLLGYLTAPPKTQYTGILLDVEDYSYYAIMLQGYDGAWQYHIQFTTEPHSPAFLYGFYLALGHLARLLGMSIPAMWHAARIVASLILMVVLFAFIGRFLRNPSARFFAYLLGIFGSGFDWTLLPSEHLDIVGGAPVDFRMPEAHLFFTALSYPHISVGITLLMVAFWLWLDALRVADWRRIAALAVVNLGVGIVYPFLIYLVAGVLGLHWVVSSVRDRRVLWRPFAFLVISGLLAAPLFAYYEYVLATNPVFRVWNAQAVTLSPSPLHYLWAYGVMLALALAAWPIAWGRTAERTASDVVASANLLFLWIWVIMAALLLYAPLNAQRRFVEGLQVPLSILATVGVCEFVAPWIEKTRLWQRLVARPGYSTAGLRRFLAVAFLLVMSAANAIVVVRLAAFTAIDQSDAFFRPRAEVVAVDWLRSRTAPSAAVLGAYWTGSFIPARAGNAVFVGQRYETSDFVEKIGWVGQFFDAGTDDAWRISLLQNYHIDYVFFGPRERALGSFDPNRAAYLTPVFSNEAIRIYRVHIGVTTSQRQSNEAVRHHPGL